MAEERISELGDISIETSKTENQRQKKKKEEELNSQGLWDNYKRCNMQVMGRPEEKKEKKREKKYPKQ